MNSIKESKFSIPGRDELPSAGVGRAVQIQYGLLPYRLSRAYDVELLLVPVGETLHWTIPKGWPIKGLAPAKSAGREGYEKVGIKGTLGRKSVGVFSWINGDMTCEVHVFPILVSAQRDMCLDGGKGISRWFTLSEALAHIDNRELRYVIGLFAETTMRHEKRKIIEASTNNELGGLIATKEAAEKFGVTERTVRRWIAAGKMPTRVNDGREKKFRTEDIELKMSGVTIQEAAEALCVTVRTVRRWIAAGKMPPRTNEGKKMKFRRVDIQALVAQTLEEKQI